MKTIINKKTEITEQIKQDSPETKKLGYADLAIITLNIAPERGWTVEEMRIRLTTEEKLKDHKLNAKIKLEDAEFNKVVECSKLNWNFKHKDILDYCDHLAEVGKT